MKGKTYRRQGNDLGVGRGISNNTNHRAPREQGGSGRDINTSKGVVVSRLRQWERVEEGKGGSGWEEVGT